MLCLPVEVLVSSNPCRMPLSVLVFLTHDSFCPYHTVRAFEILTSAGTSSTPRSGEMDIGHSDTLTVEAEHFTDSPAPCDVLLETSTSTGRYNINDVCIYPDSSFVLIQS